MSVSTKLSRRAVFLALASSFFLLALIFASVRLMGICENGSCEPLTNLRHKLPSIQFPDGSNEKAHHDNEQPAVDESNKTTAIHHHNDADCSGFPDTSNVLTIMKTGASEASSKIPTQLMTNLKCLKDFLIFSDLEQEIVGYKVHDSLDTVLPEAKTDNKDFNLYRRQKQCVIDIDACNKNSNAASEAWALDKYKNIHMAEKTYHLRPHYEWYLFVDADTYVLWPTMSKWLKRLDSSKPQYMGSVAMVGGFPFAHGGSGYLVSQGAMQALFGNQTNVANRWDQEIRKWCCGDAVFSKALKNETGVGVKNIWPTINGEKPHTLAYNDRQWCQPIATMHHVGSQDVSDLHAFERQRSSQEIIRIKDVFHHFVEPHLVAVRTDWDNLSDSVWYLNLEAKHEGWEKNKAKTTKLTPLEKAAWTSARACEVACASLDNCFQWRFYNGICTTSDSFKHGHPTKDEKEAEKQYMSGWNVDKIRSWVASNNECSDTHWPNLD